MFAAIPFPHIDPAALTLPALPLGDMQIGPFPLRWYALAYLAGLVIGWRYMVAMSKDARLWNSGQKRLTPAACDDYLFWATLGVIVGGRLGFVLFYKPNMLWENPFEVFQLWNGGLSFHGGLIGVAGAALWFTRQLHVDEAAFETAARAKAVEQPPEGKAAEFTRVREIGWIKKSDFEAALKKARTVKVDLMQLGDLAAAAAFYARLGWRRSPLSNDDVVWFTTADSTIGLYPHSFLAAEAGIEPATSHPLVTFALDVESPAAVRDVFAQALRAGATVLRPPDDQPWGGYSGFLRVHDALMWEITFNPDVRFGPDGRTLFP